MKAIRNLKLTVKLLGSFFILIIAMIVIGAMGVLNMNTLNENSSRIYNNNFKSTVEIMEIQVNITQARLYTQRLVQESYSDMIQEHLDLLTEIAGRTSDNMTAYEDLLIEGSDDVKLFDDLKTIITQYRTEREAVFSLAQEGKFSEADALNNSTIIPIVEKAEVAIQALIDFNLNDAQATLDTGEASFKSSTIVTIIIVAVIGFLAIVLGIFISSLITKPLNAVREVSQKIADGDLTATLPELYLEQKDEVGMLAHNVDAMKLGLIDTVSGIKNSAHDLGDAVSHANEILGTLNDRITDASAATEELSAGMEETGASAQEMNATAAEIERAVETVAEKAEDGAGKSGEIHKRASELGKHVNDSIEKSNNIFGQIKTSLEKALEDSKAVNEINALADAILGITSQTTLLALNASIEAARAGEAGRGFAVVANEISALADNSKNTVTQIQAITKVVMSAVGDLADSSTNLLNFVANEVMSDYKDMLDAANSYDTDAIYMSDMTSDLSATSEELLASLQVLMRAINEVAAAAQEGAKTTTVVAEQTTDISVGASGVVENVKDAGNTANQLVNMVNKFKL